MGDLLRGDPENEALVGRVLYLVIGQRCATLRALADACAVEPLPEADRVAFVEKPLDPVDAPLTPDAKR